jgi:hypothetical protein
MRYLIGYAGVVALLVNFYAALLRAQRFPRETRSVRKMYGYW